ncbi:MAG: hybrid sensor histidine kinase/response regulator, partial [Deltaproteobacteria bacterium]|nr:hybrid sensor histidine kinase/response regulator [Deltaproteobacteria bacterium]
IDPEVKVIIATGYTAAGKVKETLESGAAGFIGKPYRLAEILKKIREVLDKDS